MLYYMAWHIQTIKAPLPLCIWHGMLYYMAWHIQTIKAPHPYVYGMLLSTCHLYRHCASSAFVTYTAHANLPPSPYPAPCSTGHLFQSATARHEGLTLTLALALSLA